MRVQKRQDTSLEQLFHDGYCHIFRDNKTKVGRDGRLKGEILFLKLNEKQEILGRRTLAGTGTFQEAK